MNQECGFPTSKHAAYIDLTERIFATLEKEFPSVVWVRVDKLMCNQTTCFTEMNGIPLYKDGGHLNDVGSRMLAKRWLEEFGNPLTEEQKGQGRAPG